MTAQVGYLLDVPELYQQPLTTSLAIGQPNFAGYGLEEIIDVPMLFGAHTRNGSTTVVSHSAVCFVMPTYADDLFNHWLLVPSRLNMGNLLSNQSRSIEIANLFLTPQAITRITNNAGLGITLNNVPVLPDMLLPFDSFVLQLSVSTDGPPTINGTIDLSFTGAPDISAPITGTRVTMFPWQPEVPITETLEWYTDVQISQSDDEQRSSVLLAPRRRLKMTIMQDDPVSWQRMHNVLFDWLPRVFGVPLWMEQRTLGTPAGTGNTVLNVDTTNGDFQAGGLVMVINVETGYFEAFQIDTLSTTQINLTSQLVQGFSANDMCMPVRTAYANTQPAGSRFLNNLEQLNIEFLTLDNTDVGDATGQSTLNGVVLLDDPNVTDNQLSETWSRNVTVIDNKSGRVFQSTLQDRSRMRTAKGWEVTNLADLWRIRRLLHSFRGSQKAFYIPSFRADFVVVQDIGGGATSFRVANVGYTQFVASRGPMNVVRLLMNDGTSIIRTITGSSEDGVQEVINVNSSFSGTVISVASIKRAEFVWLMRIADDRATFVHSAAGAAKVSVNLLSVKA